MTIDGIQSAIPVSVITIVKIGLIMAFIGAIPGYAQAEESETAAERMEQALQQLADTRGEDDVMLPESPVSIALDEETREAYLSSLRKYYGYRAAGLDHRKAVFQWQLFSAKVIFVAVLALVALGMYFAAVQFNIDMRKRGKNAEDANQSTDTQIELNTTGIKLTSPVLGVAILALSLGFFYLYLVFVYPIEDIF